MAKRIPIVKFKKEKYGNELLIDVVTIEMIRGSKNFSKVMRHTFYGIMLTTGGVGDVEVDGVPCKVRKGLVAFSRPGDVCTVLKDKGLTSIELIFERDFVLSFLHDRHFLDDLPYFASNRPSPYVQLDVTLYNKIKDLYKKIQLELTLSRNIHLIRAMLYEVLALLLNANPVRSWQRDSSEPRITRFCELVNEHFKTETGVEFYAKQLKVSTNYLNRMVRETLGQSSKGYILSRSMEEACRMLRYTTLTVKEVAHCLGFDNTSYFIRIFTKIIGKTPQKFRTMHEK